MSERMSDERLAEDVEVSLLATTDAKVWAEVWYRIFQKPDLLPDGDYVGWMISWFANAFAAQEFVDAKRIRELEAQHRELCKFQERAIQRAEAAEALLRAVGELPGKWRTWRYGGKNTCADELDALLKEARDE